MEPPQAPGGSQRRREKDSGMLAVAVHLGTCFACSSRWPPRFFAYSRFFAPFVIINYQLIIPLTSCTVAASTLRHCPRVRGPECISLARQQNYLFAHLHVKAGVPATAPASTCWLTFILRGTPRMAIPSMSITIMDSLSPHVLFKKWSPLSQTDFEAAGIVDNVQVCVRGVLPAFSHTAQPPMT